MYHQHPVEVLEPDTVADLPETDTLLVQVTSRALFEQAHIPGAARARGCLPSPKGLGFVICPGGCPIGRL